MTALGIAARIALSAATLLFLASMGGGMLLAAPVLVPLHWAAVRRSGPVGTAWFALLAGASVAQVSWMVAYALTGHEVIAAVTGPVVLVTTAAGLAAARARRVPASPPDGRVGTTRRA